MLAIIGAVALVLFVCIACALTYRYAPVCPNVPTADELLRKLTQPAFTPAPQATSQLATRTSAQPIKKTPRQWPVKVATTLTTILLFYVFGAVWGLLLWLLAEHRLYALPPSVFIVTAEPYVGVWLPPGLLLGILTSGTVTQWAMYWRMGPRYHDYYYGPGVLFGGRQPQILMHFTLLCMLGLLVYVIVAINCYTRFDDANIAIQEVWAFWEKSYPYASVDKIIETPHPISSRGPFPRTSFSIVFKDGRVWSSEDYGHSDLDIPKDAQVMEYVSKKAGVAIRSPDGR